MTDYFTPENKLPGSREYLSPSGRFKLTVENYKTGKGCWNYTKGIVTNVDNGEIISEIKRNYSVFTHNFFIKNQSEWLFCGRTYMSQCFINLETGEEFDNSDKINKESLCWANVMANPSGTILAVEACIWGGPYVLDFYDFSDPSKGWSHIPYHNYDDDYDLTLFRTYELKWLSDSEFQYQNNREIHEKSGKEIYDMDLDEITSTKNDNFIEVLYYKVILSKVGSNMEFTSTETSPEHQADLKDDNSDISST
ncbi:hypothetical protein [Acanthamoeba castellanii mimivirus]|uniref:Uncharacterized protein R762 n=5 Tax=Mimivirus TaxID=315393 RepID=YR762_MIMIV|nr:hypothetical protein MIMI_gp0822 [Acanthamoeba polyphaga mimivirus]Q5UPQ1.1 RecName: Full=Uncharacterized protein R762 [Acanthamoeba polyphaga mimivirus]AEQ60975.1 hypothetical protein [Acanthamoeba castellanii mamavirus]AHA45068.1 hypothetical protein HIRU_S162 [Hirudovirus strain Sangsue]AHJ40360.1 hypothetical protein [Samba virus]ALR84383.1 hypothetical protein [Niemeyer virus]AMZ03205.1 hypothetical protein [Mimivirus Bombay]EJN40614.1 hypothetical protein lvs_R665 [Acanthamoeba poly